MWLRILTKLAAKSYKQYTVRCVPYALRIHDLSTEGTCDFCFSTNAAVEILNKHCEQHTHTPKNNICGNFVLVSKQVKNISD